MSVAAVLIVSGGAHTVSVSTGQQRDPEGEFRDVKGVGDARPSSEAPGLMEVRLPDGAVITSHGPDFEAPADDSSLAPGDSEVTDPLLEGVPGQEGTSSADPRDPDCAPSASSYHTQVLYGHPATKPSNKTQLADRIRSAVRKMNGIVHERGLQTSNNNVRLDYEVRCTASGGIDIEEFKDRDGSGSSDSFASVVQAAKSAGFDRTNVKYLIFWDSVVRNSRGDPICGQGELRYDSSRSVQNANNHGTNPYLTFGGSQATTGVQAEYGVMYKYDDNHACFSGYTASHESGHTMGAVQQDAPHSTGAGHCFDESDRLCYDDGGPRGAREDLIFPCAVERWDCGADDYFDAGASSGYLGSHWNLGWEQNRFLRFR